MMNWLVWKEYRLNRLILILGAVLLVVPHAVALVLARYGIAPPGMVAGGMSAFSANLLLSGVYCVAISQFTLVLLGGHAIACERVDRSAEFLAYLPVSRARILAGKLTLALLTAVLIWVPNLLIMLLASLGLPDLSEPSKAQLYRAAWQGLGCIALTGFMCFSVAWLLSSLLESPTFAIFGGLISCWLVMMGVELLAWAFDFSRQTLAVWYVCTCLVLAVASFVAGTWYYLRRVEP